VGRLKLRLEVWIWEASSPCPSCAMNVDETVGGKGVQLGHFTHT
jgi:hypothetical protein